MLKTSQNDGLDGAEGGLTLRDTNQKKDPELSFSGTGTE